MVDLITIGEALIDFLSIDRGVNIEDSSGFTFAPGGAPANVAAAVSRLGKKAGFIGKVGRDSFGKLIRNTLEGAGVDITCFYMDRTVNTTLAFISVKSDGEPDFVFYRNHCGADLALRQDEIDEGYILNSDIVHYGSISFIGEPLRSATLKTIKIARGAGKILSYDPNLRPSLWENLEIARSEIQNGLQFADIVKITEEELEFITETSNILKGTDTILKYGPRAIVVTRGKKSCFFNNGELTIETPAFEVKAVDTTGAGDAFVGGLLVKILDRMKEGKNVFIMEKEEAEEIMRFAHACGAITVTRKGVIPVLPFREEVETFLSTHP